MSEESPYTFHAIGAEGEPKHYELQDTSGRVVCKAFLCKNRMMIHAADSILEVVGNTSSELEEVMRDFLHC